MNVTIARRGCGFPKASEDGEHSCYIESRGSPDGVLPPIVLLLPAVQYEGEHFRGPGMIDGDALLRGEPPAVWAPENSKRRAADEKHRIDVLWDA